MPSLGARILGVLLYMIPWTDSLTFGNHLYIKYPFIQIIQIPAIPIILIERSIPFGSFLLFLAIFLGLVRNTKVSYFLRFNALQSLLINIGIIIVSFIFDAAMSWEWSRCARLNKTSYFPCHIDNLDDIR